MKSFYGKIKSCGHIFGGLHQKRLAVFYRAAYMIRQTAVGKRYIFAAFVHRNFTFFVEPSEPGGRGSSAGNAAYNNDFHNITS